MPVSARTSNIKVRTGCVTCKGRRVKCDERRPHCSRCERAGKQCQGYQDVVFRHQSDSGRLALLPISPQSCDSSSGSSRRGGVEKGRRQKERRLVNAKLADTAVVQFHPTIYELATLQPSLNLFGNSQEHAYFTLFHTKVARHLSGLYETSLWTTTVMQACVEDETIRKAVIAIGALDMTMLAARGPQDPVSKGMMAKHHEFAIEQYSGAIVGMRREIETSNPSLRKTLLASLLIFCFESIHGNQELALAQIQIGLNFLEQWLRKRKDAKHEAIEDTEKPGKAVDDDPISQSLGMISPAPMELEDELLQAFGRLDIASILFDEARPVAYHKVARKSGQTDLENMPTAFTSVLGAKQYIELMIRRTMHYIASALDNRNTARPHPTAVENTPGVLIGRITDYNHLSTQTEMERQQQIYLAEIIRWGKSFKPLFDTLATKPLSAPYMGAHMLKLQYNILFVAISGFLSADQTLFDQYFSHFREIVDCAEIVFNHYKRAYFPAVPSYTFDCGVIAPLCVCILWCRDRSTRRRAIKMLLSQPWREGIWDSLAAGTVCQTVLDIEEEGMAPFEGNEDLIVPANKRSIGTKMKCDFLKKTGNSSVLHE